MKEQSISDIKNLLQEQKILERERRQEEKRKERIQSNESWLRELKFDKKGEKLTKTLTNYIGILERCPDLGTFSFDTYKNKRVYTNMSSVIRYTECSMNGQNSTLVRVA